MKLLSLWGPVVLVMALIFGASSLSDPGAPPGGLSDKSAHFLAYAALGATLVRALARGRARDMTPRRALLAAVFAGVYGVTDELHQAFVPNRTPDLLDLLADVCGGAAGALLVAAGARTVSTWRARQRARRAGA